MPKVWIAKKSGCINAQSIKDGTLLFNKPVFVPQKNINGELILNKHKKSEHFIGIFYDNQKSRYY